MQASLLAAANAMDNMNVLQQFGKIKSYLFKT
jgi:hypothetical protein